MPKRISVTSESKIGRNETFHDNFKNKDMTANQFVDEIKKGNYPKFTVKLINGIPTPVSKPDNNTNNNLG